MVEDNGRNVTDAGDDSLKKMGLRFFGSIEGSSERGTWYEHPPFTLCVRQSPTNMSIIALSARAVAKTLYMDSLTGTIESTTKTSIQTS